MPEVPGSIPVPGRDFCFTNCECFFFNPRNYWAFLFLIFVLFQWTQFANLGLKWKIHISSFIKKNWQPSMSSGFCIVTWYVHPSEIAFSKAVGVKSCYLDTKVTPIAVPSQAATLADYCCSITSSYSGWHFTPPSLTPLNLKNLKMLPISKH